MIVHGVGWNGLSRAEAWGYINEHFIPMYDQVWNSKVVTADKGMHFDLVEWHEELHVTQDLDKEISKISLEGAATFRNAVFRDHMMDGMAYLLAFKDAVNSLAAEINHSF